jgi:excisionase family DNA binding protein
MGVLEQFDVRRGVRPCRRFGRLGAVVSGDTRMPVSLPAAADRLLDAREVAERLNVPESWVRSSTRSGAIPHVQLGRYQRYRWADVEAWLESCSQPGRVVRLRQDVA